MSHTVSPSEVGQDLYKQAGVDVDKGDRLVDWLQTGDQSSHSTRYGERVAGIGGFAALFRPNFAGLKDPLLVTSTDGVGTKVMLGTETGRIEGLGVDLVAMCVNDLYTIGGRPLFFLDYYATGALDEAQFKSVLTGIKRGCAQSGALLLGGETAEMPGLYGPGHIDLAGFVVGVVDGADTLGPAKVRVGDRLYALASSGFHSNGYSLIRRWLSSVPKPLPSALVQNLMLPTRIYHEIPSMLETLGTGRLHALANITGGGISGNLPRVMPPATECHIELAALPIPAFMREFIESHGSSVAAQEAVFNLGCGMIAAVGADSHTVFERTANAMGLPVTPIGEVKSGSGEPKVILH